MSKMTVRWSDNAKNRFSKNFMEPSLDGLGIGVFRKEMDINGGYEHRRISYDQKSKEIQMILFFLDGQYLDEFAYIRFYKSF